MSSDKMRFLVMRQSSHNAGRDCPHPPVLKSSPKANRASGIHPTPRVSSGWGIQFPARTAAFIMNSS